MKDKSQQQQAPISAAEEKKILTLTQRSFDASLDDLDGETLSKLHQARSAALEQLDKPNKALFSNPWASTGAFAMAASIVAVVWLINPQLDSFDVDNHKGQAANTLSQNQSVTDDLFADETLLAEIADEVWLEDEELLDNLEFITWLAMEEEFAG